ncbi:N-carbamoyl-L-amino acid hydrolase [Serratia quinivorans]|uniref:N-carbamoyl-L-amino acid hydrolase n=1 Tax=Serratia quinivorans TaxID=137545 RepID=A0A380AWF6_9GAMM|nr:N-carbamoyl-L-amino acid hydrolase [Serratia quinivorans]
MTHQVNGERLWQSLLDMAQFGAIPKDGVTRLALSEEDRQARDQLRDWGAGSRLQCTGRPHG